LYGRRGPVHVVCAGCLHIRHVGFREWRTERELCRFRNDDPIDAIKAILAETCERSSRWEERARGQKAKPIQVPLRMPAALWGLHRGMKPRGLFRDCADHAI
jgi:hypothetical protein